MFDFYERRKIKQWFYSWPSLFVLILIAVLLSRGVWGVYLKERETHVNKEQRLSYLSELESRKNSLEEEIGRLETERGVEEEIREKFEVAKVGEGVIVIVDAPEGSETEASVDERNIFQKLLDFIF